MKILKKLILPIFLVGLFGLGFHMNSQPYQNSLTKVMGPFGHGSGHIIYSDNTKSVVLTNKHVCDGVTTPSSLTQMLNFLKYFTDLYPKCATFQCLGKSNPMFGPYFLQLLIGTVGYVEVKTVYIHDYVSDLLKVIEVYKKKPVTIKFNNILPSPW